jgi:hypothetical protein
MRKHHGSQSAPKLLAYLIGRAGAAGAAAGGGGVGGNGAAPAAAHTDSEGAPGELPWAFAGSELWAESDALQQC